MIQLADASQMKAIDSHSILKLGIPSVVLMERAAFAVANRIREYLRSHGGKTVVVVCGNGNNGGDGLAVVRILNTMGYQASWYMAGNMEKATEETRLQLRILKNMNIAACRYPEDLMRCDLLADAIFGIGLTREITGAYAQVIETINHSPAPVCAIDMPSGISTDTGAICGCAVRADFTVSFGCSKLGLVMYPGASYAGQVFIEDIGFPQEALMRADIRTYAYEKSDLPGILPRRQPYSNKGSYGKVLVIAGSKDMAGACYFAAAAAYASGCGLVRIFTPAQNHDVILSRLPEAILSTYDPTSLDLRLLSETLSWADAVVLGPGLSTQAYAKEIVRYTLKNCRVPMVIDADGLNILAEEHELLDMVPKGTILTPHVGEMARLTGLRIDEVAGSLLVVCRRFAADHQVICVLKDARTLISDGNTLFVNLSGNHGMATGGSGDVLAGIIGGLLAEGLQNLEAASRGCFLHGCAGDEARKAKGAYGLLASDIIEYMSKVFLP